MHHSTSLFSAYKLPHRQPSRLLFCLPNSLQNEALQFAMLLFLKIRHPHNLHHQTGPTCEMLGSLALASFGAVLLPREASTLPFVEDGAHEVGAERGVQLCCLGLVRGGGSGGDGLIDWLVFKETITSVFAVKSRRGMKVSCFEKAYHLIQPSYQ